MDASVSAVIQKIRSYVSRFAYTYSIAVCVLPTPAIPYKATRCFHSDPISSQSSCFKILRSSFLPVNLSFLSNGTINFSGSKIETEGLFTPPVFTDSTATRISVEIKQSIIMWYHVRYRMYGIRYLLQKSPTPN